MKGICEVVIKKIVNKRSSLSEKKQVGFLETKFLTLSGCNTYAKNRFLMVALYQIQKEPCAVVRPGCHFGSETFFASVPQTFTVFDNKYPFINSLLHPHIFPLFVGRFEQRKRLSCTRSKNLSGQNLCGIRYKLIPLK